MLSYNLITKQTPPEGVQVNQIMVAEAIDLKRELYVSILMDRESMGPVFVVSQKVCGGGSMIRFVYVIYAYFIACSMEV
jgi:succinyl-CoA synthetase beta subunit